MKTSQKINLKINIRDNVASFSKAFFMTPPPPPHLANKPKKRRVCALLAIIAITLTACGGGGSSVPSTPPTPDSLIDVINRSAVQAKIPQATSNAPKVGMNRGITQTTNGTNSSTTDAIGIDVTVENGQLVYSVTRTDGVSGSSPTEIDSTDADTTVSHRFTNSSDLSGAGLYKKLDDRQLWVDTYTDYEYTAKSCGLGSAVSPGTTCAYKGGASGVDDDRFDFRVDADGNRACILYNSGQEECSDSGVGLTPEQLNVVQLLFALNATKNDDRSWTINSLGATNKPAKPQPNIPTIDTDYLAGGIWLAVPDGSTGAITFGVFVDGNDPFTQDIMALSGEATYKGDARGVHTDASTNSNAFFNADVDLTAEFGDGSAPGTIGGTISKFRDSSDDSILITGDPTLNLGSSTNIGSTNSGFFKDDINTMLGGETYTGKWGGQFYGNPADGATGDATHPGSVAGTFGGTTGSGETAKTFLGTFGAYNCRDITDSTCPSP